MEFRETHRRLDAHSGHTDKRAASNRVDLIRLIAKGECPASQEVNEILVGEDQACSRCGSWTMKHEFKNSNAAKEELNRLELLEKEFPKLGELKELKEGLEEFKGDLERLEELKKFNELDNHTISNHLSIRLKKYRKLKSLEAMDKFRTFDLPKALDVFSEAKVYYDLKPIRVVGELSGHLDVLNELKKLDKNDLLNTLKELNTFRKDISRSLKPINRNFSIRDSIVAYDHDDVFPVVRHVDSKAIEIMQSLKNKGLDTKKIECLIQSIISETYRTTLNYWKSAQVKKRKIEVDNEVRSMVRSALAYAHYKIGDICLDPPQHDRALKHLSKDMSIVHHNIGLALDDEGTYHVELTHFRARIFFAMKRYKEAFAEIYKAINEFKPNKESGLFMDVFKTFETCGDFCRELGRNEDAKAFWLYSLGVGEEELPKKIEREARLGKGYIEHLKTFWSTEKMNIGAKIRDTHEEIKQLQIAGESRSNEPREGSSTQKDQSIDQLKKITKNYKKLRNRVADIEEDEELEPKYRKFEEMNHQEELQKLRKQMKEEEIALKDLLIYRLEEIIEDLSQLEQQKLHPELDQQLSKAKQERNQARVQLSEAKRERDLTQKKHNEVIQEYEAKLSKVELERDLARARLGEIEQEHNQAQKQLWKKIKEIENGYGEKLSKVTLERDQARAQLNEVKQKYEARLSKDQQELWKMHDEARMWEQKRRDILKLLLPERDQSSRSYLRVDEPLSLPIESMFGELERNRITYYNTREIRSELSNHLKLCHDSKQRVEKDLQAEDTEHRERIERALWESSNQKERFTGQLRLQIRDLLHDHYFTKDPSSDKQSVKLLIEKTQDLLRHVMRQQETFELNLPDGLSKPQLIAYEFQNEFQRQMQEYDLPARDIKLNLEAIRHLGEELAKGLANNQ